MIVDRRDMRARISVITQLLMKKSPRERHLRRFSLSTDSHSRRGVRFRVGRRVSSFSEVSSMTETQNFTTLDEWLHHIETLHAKPIDMGLERMQMMVRKWHPLFLPRDHGGRPRTARFDRRNARVDLPRRGLQDLRAHVAASSALQRARPHQRDRGERRRPDGGLRRSGGSPRRDALLLRIHGARHPASFPTFKSRRGDS